MRDMRILWFGCIVGIQTHVKTINGSEVTIRIDNRSWSYSGQGEIWCPLLNRAVYNLSTWCNFFHSSRYGVMCGDKAQDMWDHTCRNNMWELFWSMNVDEWCCGCWVLFEETTIQTRHDTDVAVKSSSWWWDGEVMNVVKCEPEFMWDGTMK